MKQYDELPVTPIDPTTGLEDPAEAYLISVPREFRQGAARHGAKGRRCFVCGTVYGELEGIVKGGRFYCYKNKCFEDVVGGAK